MNVDDVICLANEWIGKLRAIKIANSGIVAMQSAFELKCYGNVLSGYWQMKRKV
jgi:hypothetical protein